ncbi:MAG: dTDP-4-dehydrorhamnose reductase [Deltaproteobacteria bacterium]|nr:dTDP-4-dehydrorhamnose reductase [Deltaproteobacteria bacterium]
MILVFGKTGQVAQALMKDLTDLLHRNELIFLGSDEANFLKPDLVIEKLNQIKPNLIINASAYTQVDKAEIEKEESMEINAVTPGRIAEWCKLNLCPLVHFSTDYVFDGGGEIPWTESMSTSAINYYGETKLQGEKLIQGSGATYYIFRVSWVYAPWGKNFPKTICRLAQEREELSIVNDQMGSPTDAREISAFIKLTLNQKKNGLNLDPGIYHLRFKPFMSWFDVAKLTIDEARKIGIKLKLKDLKPIPSTAFPTPAKRPLNSRLDTEFPQIQKVINEIKNMATVEKWGYLK